MKPLRRLLLVIALPLTSFGQRSDSFPRAIEDNSFLIEEAYNQGEGIVQHITTAAVSGSPSSVEYGFTQEWPVGSRRHQFSYTVPLAPASTDHTGGVGNVLLTYRYQLMSPETDGLALAPRATLVLPSTVAGFQTDLTKPGVEFNLPLSVRPAASIVYHVNVGGAYLPGTRHRTSDGGDRRFPLASLWVGGSTIWLLNEHHNLLFEVRATWRDDVDDAGQKRRIRDLAVSPGYRHALDVGSMQVVPGIAVPLTATGTAVHASVFLYLSLEHPF